MKTAVIHPIDYIRFPSVMWEFFVKRELRSKGIDLTKPFTRTDNPDFTITYRQAED